ncbi:hypothetical protein ACFZDI_08355 [Streptomyces sp. NPDC007907]
MPPHEGRSALSWAPVPAQVGHEERFRYGKVHDVAADDIIQLTGPVRA